MGISVVVDLSISLHNGVIHKAGLNIGKGERRQADWCDLLVDTARPPHLRRRRIVAGPGRVIARGVDDQSVCDVSLKRCEVHAHGLTLIMTA